MDTDEPVPRLARLSNARVFLESGLVAFRIETDKGAGDIALSVPEIGDIFQFLAELAAAHAENVPTESRPEAQPYLTAIPAKGIGFRESQNPDRTLIVMQFAGLALGFEVENSALAALADDIGRIARTLSAPRSTPN